MKVLKSVILLTILRPAGEGVGLDNITDYALQDIGHNIDDGPWLGSMQLVGVETEVPPERQEAECQALGCDDNFFAEPE
jgi:hypothetical protein